MLREAKWADKQSVNQKHQGKQWWNKLYPETKWKGKDMLEHADFGMALIAGK